MGASNLRVHRANRVREWAVDNTEKIELFYLPPHFSRRRVRAWNASLPCRIVCGRTSAMSTFATLSNLAI